jgi:two-component system sensor histidine kinase GlrK
MRLYYPRSFLKLVLVGFLLVAMPTLFVLLSMAVSVDQLARRSQTAVQEAAQATQASRRVMELVSAMERNARQFAIVGEQSMLENYQANRDRLANVVKSFANLALERERKVELARLVEVEQEIFATLSDPDAEKQRVAQAVTSFAELSELAQSIMTRSSDLIDAEIAALRKQGDDVRGMVFWELLALVPAVIILVAGSTIMVARPITEIDSAIRRIGAGDLGTEVVVHGPEDLRHLGRQLDWLRRRMHELEQQRTKFLQHVSHELKSPLTALREGSELLVGGMAGSLNTEQLEIASILRENSVHLQRLIVDLLNYGAATSDKLALNMGPVDFKSIVERAVTSHGIALRMKRLSLSASCPDVSLNGDAEKLRVVVDNLISNAIKFSPAGSEIKLVVERSGEAVTVDVSDSGPGIAEGDKDRVFAPFYRGRAAHDAGIKGTGLGLSIVREYVVAHGGSVEVVDAGRRGGHLRVLLPRKHADETAAT